MSEYTPTTDEVRIKYRLSSGRNPGDYAEFDRWLAEHDHQVRVDYELRRDPSPILIENVDSQPAGAWLAEHDAALVEKLADAIEIDLGRGFTGADDHNATAAAEVWLRARADEIREGSRG